MKIFHTKKNDPNIHVCRKERCRSRLQKINGHFQKSNDSVPHNHENERGEIANIKIINELMNNCNEQPLIAPQEIIDIFEKNRNISLAKTR